MPFLPPVRSPLTFRSVLAAAGMAGRGQAGLVQDQLKQEYVTREILLTDSGTSALALALRELTPAGRPAALPAWGCYDLATAADAAGVPVRLYDLDPGTLGPDWDSLERALAGGAGSLVAAHFFGVPVDLDRMAARAAAHGAAMIEDAAQGAGGSWRGRPLGSFGSLTVLSFGRGKGITGGRGGALLAHDQPGMAALERARAGLPPAPGGGGEMVKLAAQWLLARPSLYWIPASLPFLGLGETVYRKPAPPAGMSPQALRVLSTTWPLRVREAEVRRENATEEMRELRELRGIVLPAVPEGGVAGYLRCPVILPGDHGPALRGLARLGMMPGYPRALVDLEGFAPRVVNRDEAFPGARLLARRLVTLPTHRWVRDADVGRVVRWLEAARRQGGKAAGTSTVGGPA